MPRYHNGKYMQHWNGATTFPAGTGPTTRSSSSAGTPPLLFAGRKVNACQPRLNGNTPHAAGVEGKEYSRGATRLPDKSRANYVESGIKAATGPVAQLPRQRVRAA